MSAERTVAVALSSDPAPGITGHGFTSFGRPSVNASGQVAFLGSTRSTTEPTILGSGVWVGAPGDLGAVAVTGALTPDATEVFDSVFMNNLRLVSLNDDGEVVFVANATTTSGPPITTQGLWKGDRQSATRLHFLNEPTPEAGDGYFLTNFSNSTPAINNRGDVLFATWVYSPSVGMRRSLWLTPEGGERELVAAEAPIGGPLGVAAIPNYYADYPDLSSGGEVTFAARGPANSASSNPLGIAVHTDEGLRVLAMHGEAAPGLPGLLFNSVGLDNSAGLGAALVYAQLSDGRRGLWLLGSEGLEPRLIAGDPVPGGASGEVINEFFYQGVVNSQGVVAAYGGTLNVNVRKTGVWLSDADGARLVAKEGEPAPGTDGVFRGFIRSEPILNSRGQVAFLGSVEAASMFSGIWATNPQGALVKIVKAGDEVEVAPGDVRTVQSVQLATGSGGDDGRPSPFNDVGQLVYSAIFTDTTSAVLLSEAVAQLEGDYNADGAVDDADYDVWRSAYGSGLAAADGNGDGVVDAIDYTLWRDQRGARLFTFQAPGAIPEPAAAALALLTAAAWLSSPRRRG